MSSWSENDIHDLVEKAGKYEFDYTGDITEEDIEWAEKIIKEREDD